MQTIQKAPAVTEVQLALDAAERGWVHRLLLMQNVKADASQIQRFDAAHPDAGLPALADALGLARKNFNAALRANCESAQKHADELSNAFVQNLLGTSLPSDVTLPLGKYGSSATRKVAKLTSVSSDRNGQLCGFFEVSDISGRSRESQRFYSEHGQLYFAEPDIY
jgi:type VI protein secretion system component VasK